MNYPFKNLTFTCLLLFTWICPAFSQHLFFNKVPPPDGKTFVHVTGITQDRTGYMWLSTKKGLCRYDGYQMITYKNNSLDQNSLASDIAESICVDSTGMVWIGTDGAGLDRFDPSTGIFKHFRHNPGVPGSLSDDWVSAVMIDREGTLWAGTGTGLDRYDPQTGTFEHLRNKPGDSTSISSNEVTSIYEDREGTIWIGTGSVYGADKAIMESGGLNRMNKITGTFTRYMHDPRNPNSLINNKVRAIFEDSKGVFWVGTGGDGLHTMDRKKGTFIRHEYDPAQPEKLSRPPISKDFPQTDMITFIREDATGGMWIGTSEAGINYLDPQSKKITHYESENDVDGNYADRTVWAAYTSRDGVMWISSLFGNLYRVDPFRKEIRHATIGRVGAFYQQPNGTLWVASDNGLFRKDTNNVIIPWTNADKELLSLTTGHWVSVIRGDNRDNLWIGGEMGLFRRNLKTGQLTTYIYDPKNKDNRNNWVTDVQQDEEGNLWIGTIMGVYFKDHKTGSSTQYLINSNDTFFYGQNLVTAILLDKKDRVWAGSSDGGGLNLFSKEQHVFKNYLNVFQVNCIFEDEEGDIWVGTNDGLYKYDSISDLFVRYKDLNSLAEIPSVSSIVEDDQGCLWLGTTGGIIRINPQRNETNIYGKSYGIGQNLFINHSSYKGYHGEIYFGDTTGYYSFNPQELTSNVRPPEIVISAFSLADQIVKPGKNGPLKESLSVVKEIILHYDQNVFSFDFSAIDYTNPEANRHLFMLENYDKYWHQANSEHRAYYFNVPPGEYIFKIKAANSHGVWAEKKIAITIMPPWWRTWWAYTLFAGLFVAIIWAIISYRSRQLRRENKILEEKVNHRTIQLQQSLDNLKATQSQLIQSEKMASLGELTAGIAHEIQNPLNFVNNFSEVNKELLVEMKDEMKRGNIDDANAIANDVIDNEEKINHHGKRADAIVKGMLQHSRSSTGVKEPTDINALADEYLRLSYHGLRAKDKEFNAIMKTEFDETIGKINIIQQDIGRVLLNLYNNAFYAVTEKKKRQPKDYEPTVLVSSKKMGDKVILAVTDNGNGIPQNIIDKIFQPFFTTKPTGEGTGLGLSLSYDIIKAHGGEIKVDTKQGDGTEFIIEIPLTKT